MKRETYGKRIAYLGLFAGMAILFGYIEMLIPFHFGIPGMKLGLSNIVTVFVLYLCGPGAAAAIMLVRIFTAGFLFGNAYGILYSLAGGILSLAGMGLLKKCKRISMVGVSILGGVLHNMGQLLAAAFVVKALRIVYYAPVLIIAGTLTGFLIGVAANLVYSRIQAAGFLHRTIL
ncbi:MAG: Gx transporter family protein [Lachnospiraceae bacterium]